MTSKAHIITTLFLVFVSNIAECQTKNTHTTPLNSIYQLSQPPVGVLKKNITKNAPLDKNIFKNPIKVRLHTTDHVGQYNNKDLAKLRAQVMVCLMENMRLDSFAYEQMKKKISGMPEATLKKEIEQLETKYIDEAIIPRSGIGKLYWMGRDANIGAVKFYNAATTLLFSTPWLYKIYVYKNSDHKAAIIFNSPRLPSGLKLGDSVSKKGFVMDSSLWYSRGGKRTQ